jgi:hypothetical protein
MWLITYTLPVTHPEINSCSLHISIKIKGQTLRNGFALLKNDITNNLEPQKPVIYSANI